ncbi:MAG: SGNH/GDSL hydrolase family protein [Bacteroidota bacterium]
MATRRNFIRQASFAAGAGITLAACANTTSNASAMEQSEATAPQSEVLFAGKTIVFQGDSITDGGRRKDQLAPNAGGALGGTYPLLISAQILGSEGEQGTKFYNRGISGNKVFQLAERWEEDCINLKPDILTILIGVNDFWHMVDGNYDGTVEIYERDFMALIERTKAALPNVKIIIAEPFAVAGGRAITERWDQEFPAYQAAAKRVAEAHNTQWIATQALFDQALENGSVDHWCPDGVHPAPAGHHLMAEAWIEALREAAKSK